MPRRRHMGEGLLNRNALDLIQRDRIVGAVIELGGARALMCGHRLRVLESAAGLEVGGDAGRAENVAAELALEAGLSGAPADHAISVDAVHRTAVELPGLAARGTEEGAFTVLPAPGRIDV